MTNKFHKGELTVQRLAGEELKASNTGRVISNVIVKGAINFIENQVTAIISSKDEEGAVWISMLVGKPFFIKVDHPSHVSIDKESIVSSLKDPLFANIKYNQSVGGLFIELSSRRRFRINGVLSMDDASIKIKVKEAYPNCPKYIQSRIATSLAQPIDKNRVIQGEELDTVNNHWISNSDTFFVGSAAHNNMDASHRGGEKGFIEILPNGVLKIPDYQGNSMYNTLGNFVENPNAGLLFVDFEKGKTLQLTGTVELLFDQNSDKDLKRTTDTGRYWLFTIKKWIRLEDHHQMNWKYLDASPFNP